MGKFACWNGHGAGQAERGGQHRARHQTSRRRAPRCHRLYIRRILITQGLCRTRFSFCFHATRPREDPRHALTRPTPSLQLTQLELSFLSSSLGDEVVLRRLCILLALKSAYIKAIGQPIGFDWSRLEFNISEETCSGDGQPLTGWEFRLYKAHLGVQRRGILVEESYQCVTAHFRGTADSKFVWQDNNKDLESWVQFINIDQMTNVIPKLTD